MLVDSSNRASGTDGNQHVEPEDGRWQHNGQGHDSFNGNFPPSSRKGQPVRDGQSQKEQDEGSPNGQTKAQPDCNPVQSLFFSWQIEAVAP